MLFMLDGRILEFRRIYEPRLPSANGCRASAVAAAGRGGGPAPQQLDGCGAQGGGHQALEGGEAVAAETLPQITRAGSARPGMQILRILSEIILFKSYFLVFYVYIFILPTIYVLRLVL